RCKRGKVGGGGWMRYRLSAIGYRLRKIGAARASGPSAASRPITRAPGQGRGRNRCHLRLEVLSAPEDWAARAGEPLASIPVVHPAPRRGPKTLSADEASPMPLCPGSFGADSR